MNIKTLEEKYQIAIETLQQYADPEYYRFTTMPRLLADLALKELGIEERNVQKRKMQEIKDEVSRIMGSHDWASYTPRFSFVDEKVYLRGVESWQQWMDTFDEAKRKLRLLPDECDILLFWEVFRVSNLD